jgi:hypothetical protein
MFTADNVIFGYKFNKLAFTVPTPSLTDTDQDPDVTGRFFAGNTGYGANIMNASINFIFTTTETQKLTISWGDGFFGEIDLIVGPNPIARNEHEYTDKLDEHTIVFSFEKPKAISAISTLNVNVGDIISEDLKKFTGLESLNFGQKSGIQEFPADLSTLINLKNLSVLDSDIPKIDGSIFSLPLEKLSLRRSIDFSTTEASDSLERLAEFVFLEDLNFAGTKLTEFPVNFINRNRLVSLTIGENNEFTILPINIPISLESLFLEEKNPQLTSYENFDRLVNLRSLILDGTFDNVNVAIGDELASCELLKTISYKRDSITVLARTNAIVNNLFDFIVTRGYGNITTGGSDKFRDMSISLIIGGSNNTQNRPSGTYQAPSGFNKNVSNGTPANELEKVYCLVENYGHTWEVGDGNTNSGEETFSPS